MELVHGTIVIDGGAGDKVVAADHHLEWRSTDVLSVVLDCYVILARSHRSVGHFVAIIDFIAAQIDFAGSVDSNGQSTWKKIS